MAETIRIDKWLWCVRIFKTRSIATDECKKGRIIIDGFEVKPSREIKIGEIIDVKKSPVTYRYKVLGLPSNRLGAKLVPEYLADITPAENLKILEVQKYMTWIERDKGTGRPTKKDRREMDRFRNFDE